MTSPPMQVPEQARVSIHTLLTRFYVRVTLAAVAIAAVSVLVTGFVVLSSYAERNLELVARQAAYSVEPALVFNDRAAVQSIISDIAANGSVAGIRVTGADGRTLARWDRGAGRLDNWLADLVHSGPARADISHDGVIHGVIEVRGSADGVARFLSASLLGVAVCVLLTALGTLIFVERFRARVHRAVSGITSVAGQIRFERNFALRAPASDIRELHDLGQDFNALVGDMDNWHKQLLELNLALQHQADHDMLTRLPNRKLFVEKAENALKTAMRTQENFAILFIDGDGFKNTNDLHGHAAGDAVLVETARRVAVRLRAGDIAARIGGDEFAVLAHYMTDRSHAETLASRIRAAMAEPITLPGGEKIIASISVGIAFYPDDGADIASIMQTADDAMYAIKRGRKKNDEQERQTEP